MGLVLTTGASITCPHGGRVLVTPRQQRVTAGGLPVLCSPALEAAPIVGCLQPPTPSTKPCTTLVSTVPGSTSTVVTVAGMPVYLDSLSGITDGVPPGIVTVTSAGQTRVRAALAPGGAG